MSSEAAIHAVGLGKLYRIGSRERYRTLRDTLAQLVRSPLRVAGNFARGSQVTADNALWALKDLSLEVRMGEVVGIIGHNGAGKSTLLKILSRITEPTEGRVELRGRVGALLEVATGFHPELTGRENVFLNGAILGMSKAEIARKFDEIVAFAEVEPFLDTPVKHYSSGMYVRLAFAVAAHLEPEILLVDEVLAVGDMKFQKKCLSKTSDVAREGRAVLVVSHNMQAIASLCSRAVCLDHGRIVDDGPVSRVVATYLHRLESSDDFITVADRAPDARFPTGPMKSGYLRFTRIWMLNSRGAPSRIIHFREPFEVHATFEVLKPLPALRLGGSISTPDGVRLTNSHHTDGGLAPLQLGPGTYAASMRVANLLAPGNYLYGIGAHDLQFAEGLEWLPRGLDFTVVPFSEDGATLHDDWHSGYFYLPTDWSEVVPVPG